jgi:diacylglycerol kinase (ATP)
VRIVVTPGSGDGRALGTARRLRRRLRRRGHAAGIVTFGDLPSIERWARECEPDFTHLVCVGGDATQSAAATAAIRCGVPFVPVPTGFGNVFAGVFGHPSRAGAVAGLLEYGEVRRVDVGLVDDREVFLSHRSFGLLEQIQQAAERGRQQPRHRLLRHLWYYGVARRFLLQTRLAGMQVEVDGVPVADDAVLVTVANVETYRGFLSLTPAASPIDGLFDVFLIPRVSKAGLAWLLLKQMLGLRSRWQGVTLRRGRRVVVTTPRRREVLTTRRRALPLVVPPGALEALRRRTVEEEAPVTAGP